MKIQKLIIISMSLFTISCYSSENQVSEIDTNLTELRVAAYNVEVGRNTTVEQIGEELKKYNLDVIAFSEAPGGDWTQNVAAELGMEHVAVGQYSTAGHKDKYKSIASRTPLYGYEEILMADTLHTVTKAKTTIQDKEVAIYSVHFPFGWRDQAHIDETTGKISTFVTYLKERQETENIIALGDFNFIPSNDESENKYHEMFKEIGLVMTWPDLDLDPMRHNTYNAYEPEDEGSGKVIDHIMYNPEKMQAVEGSIIEMENPLSDHKPVWAVLQFKPAS